MQTSRFIRSFSFLILLTGLAACGGDQGAPTEELILGRWEIREAYRNGRPTESLAELYFEFMPDGQMSTNLLGAPETTQFAIKGDQLSQRGGQLDVDYVVQEVSDSVLELTTRLRDYDFRFRLQPAGQGE